MEQFEWFRTVNRSDGGPVTTKFPGVDALQNLVKRERMIGRKCNMQRIKSNVGRCRYHAREGVDGIGSRSGRFLMSKLLAAVYGCLLADCPNFSNMIGYDNVVIGHENSTLYCHAKGQGEDKFIGNEEFQQINQTRNETRLHPALCHICKDRSADHIGVLSGRQVEAVVVTNALL